METVILTIHLLLALGLIVVVLLQRSEGGGLGMGGGGVMTGRGVATALSKVTWALGAAFVITSLALTIIAARNSGADSVVDSILPPSPSAPASQRDLPDLGGDLLPPVPQTAPVPAPAVPAPAVPADGPATPPAAQ